MDAIEFIKERNRMCNYYKSKGSCEDKSCPAYYHCCSDFLSVEYDGFKLVDDVEKFSSEHPQKTMLQDFFVKFPKMILNERGLPERICPHYVGYDSKPYCENQRVDCVKCWNRPVKE